MRVALVTGSWPPDACGVGDYAHRLSVSLSTRGVQVRLFHRSLALRSIVDIVREIDGAGPDVVHVQYPTVGFGSRLGPHLLSLLRPGVVTLHEASRLHPLRRCSLGLFTLRARHLIFTTAHEQDFIGRWAPWTRNRSSVIPVGSSIAEAPPVAKTDSTVVCFGLFRPNKGIEDVLRLASLARDQGRDLTVRFIGSPDPRKMDYYRELRRRAEGLPVRWDVGLSESEVSRLLATVRVAYMPFPDGALDYRTSLLALLANGVAVVTTRSPMTPLPLAEAVRFAASPSSALGILCELMANESARGELDRRGRAFVRAVSWDAIADRHRDVYESVSRRTTLQSRPGKY
jgi:glycosyltransferase involved in cell wall biosynthesis